MDIIIFRKLKYLVMHSNRRTNNSAAEAAIFGLFVSGRVGGDFSVYVTIYRFIFLAGK